MKSKIEIIEMLEAKRFFMKSKSNFNSENDKYNVEGQIFALEWVLKD